MAGAVYRVFQEALGEAARDLDNPGANAIMVIGVKDNSFTFDEDDLTMTDVLANETGGGALTKSATAIKDVDATASMVVNAVANGADYVAEKTTLSAVTTEAAWVAVIIHTFHASLDSSRIPIAAFPLSITPNGSNIEIHWGGTDGVGTWMTSRNAA